MPKHNIHFVGSIGLADTETVFRTLAAGVGDSARRYPDGETGERHYAIFWQGRYFREHGDLCIPKASSAPLASGMSPPKLVPKDGVDPRSIRFDSIGYADVALESYAVFSRLKAQGVIGAGVRFQVSLPTPCAVVNFFVDGQYCEAVEPAYQSAMLEAVRKIVSVVPHHELAVQWDVYLEILAYDGAFALYFRDVLGGTVERLRRLIREIPDGVEVGVHLCYGDPGHKHILEPQNLATSVKFANAICAAMPRSIHWVHMPVPKDRYDRDFVAPLTDIEIGSAELVLGLVHLTDGIEGTRKRMRVAEAFAPNYGIATECGFGRRPAHTIADLLKLHCEAAA